MCLLSCVARRAIVASSAGAGCSPDVGLDFVDGPSSDVVCISGVGPEFGDDSAPPDAAPSSLGLASPVQSSEW